MNRHIKTGLKVAVSAIGLAWVVSNISLGNVWDAMRSAEPVWLLAAFLLMTASLFLRAQRWRALLTGLGVNVPFMRLVQLYFIGNFFNAFLPGGLGGDVVRAVAATRDVSAETSAGTVIVDRLTGLLMLFAMALIALPFRPPTFPAEWFWALLLVSVVGLVGGYLLLSGLLFKLIAWLVGSAENIITRLTNKHLLPILNTTRSCGTPALMRALAISLLFNLMLIAWWYCVARALQLDGVTIPYLFLVAPVMSLALLVPSLSGLGVREVLAPTLLAGAGVSAEMAVVLTLTIFVLLRITSLLGLPVYLLSSAQKADE